MWQVQYIFLPINEYLLKIKKQVQTSSAPHSAEKQTKQKHLAEQGMPANKLKNKMQQPVTVRSIQYHKFRQVLFC